MKIRIAFLSCLLFNCSSDPDSASMANLRPIVGKLNVGTSEYATSSYGGASNDKTPDVISLGRKAIICDTPSRFAVKRDDPQATVFSTAVRSTTTPVNPLMFMVLNAENEKIEILHSLVVTDNKWHPIQIEIEDNCREVVLTASYELPSTASDPGPNVAWAIPDFSRPAHSEEADVLIISIDTLRSSSLTFAPFLSKLMASGRNYINAYSPSNWTLPAFASLASGLTPQQHLCGRNEFAATATNDNENRVFSALSEVPTLADAFSD
ncbi:MAG: alkaline phosphatase family protein, partial [Planctomycetota bacterium]|nr:alkaline phosphatase family protein [Planctomycetota bacterium]